MVILLRPLDSQDCFRLRLALLLIPLVARLIVAISIPVAVSSSVRSVVPVSRVVVVIVVGSRHRFRFCYSVILPFVPVLRDSSYFDQNVLFSLGLGLGIGSFIVIAVVT